MGKRTYPTRNLIAFAVACGAIVLASQQSVRAGWSPGAGTVAPVVRAAARPLVTSAAAWSSSGALVTQTFTLEPGWNAIYLEVEPVNPAPIVDPDGAGPLLPVHEKATLAAVFDALACDGCLESVWTWNTPVSRMDYIVDPAEGLWDEPGWKRYFNASSTGTQGEAQAFLTNLLTLRANTGYLVKLKDDAAPVSLAVYGRPVPASHRWAKDAYNLAGFPLLPGAAPMVSDFFAGSPLTEVYRLRSDGKWNTLVPTDTLRYGEAYLVYFDNQQPGANERFTAPVQLIDPLGEGIDLSAALGRRSQRLPVENYAAGAVTITVALVGGADAGVALWLLEPVTQALRTQPAVLTLAGGGGARLHFAVRSTEQPQPGTALLAITAPALGVRWLVPVTAQGMSLAGLWVGDVVVNDVSESRLGATNVDSGALTLALRQRNQSNVRGAAELQEIVTGNTAALAVTVTLALPESTPVAAPTPVAAAAPSVAGYVFVDANQNGQRDGDEQGLANVAVTLGNIGPQRTGSDGRYLFAGVASGTHALAAALPAGYTSDFPVLDPVSDTVTVNAVPSAITMGAEGITGIEPSAYRRQVLPAPHTLPVFDATGQRMEPLLNFGLTPAHDVTLWTVGPGGCSDRLQLRAQVGQAKNGHLVAALASTALNPGQPVADLLLGGGSDYAFVVEQAGQEVACGEVVVGAPTRSAAGAGSEFRFRVVLRMSADGQVEMLPYYALDAKSRIRSAAFSLADPLAANGRLTDPGQQVSFAMGLAANDPLNPFKHKYHPDHDNLDAGFNPMDLNAVPPHLWESYEVQRRIGLTFTDDPPGVTGAEAAALAAELDWGGVTWGGLYKEVVQGIHKNAITARGYFVLQHVLTADDLQPQDYD